MKFILLRKKDKKNPYDAIIKFGCGPNFVLNRESIFRNMIKEQGSIFWFRFWFTVFYNPACDYFQMIHAHFPDMLNNAHKFIHKRFLQASSHTAASDYCLRIVKSLKTVPRENKVPSHSGLEEHVIDLARLQDMILKAAHVTFGIALCVVFYNWLESDGCSHSAQSYWSIPPDYLEQDFKPGLLEQFLATVWKEQLPILLGVSMNDVPWLRKLLQESKEKIPKSQKKLHQAQDFELTKLIEQITEELLFLQNDKLKLVISADEDVETLRQRYRKILKKQELSEERCYCQRRSDKKVSKDNCRKKTTERKCSLDRTDKKNHRDNRNVVDSSPEVVKCSWCMVQKINDTKFVPCLQCFEDKWSNPRFYCSFRCQTKHWYNAHFKEHTEYKEGKMYNRIEDEMLGSLRVTIRHYVFACVIGLCALSLFPSIVRYCIMILNVFADL